MSIENVTAGKQNQLNTRWASSQFNLKNGLDFQPDGDIFARIRHLQHDDFQYVLDVQNDNSTTINGTVRIFMSQKNNTRDRELTFEELRMLWIELDRFEVQRTIKFLIICTIVIVFLTVKYFSLKLQLIPDQIISFVIPSNQQ